MSSREIRGGWAVVLLLAAATVTPALAQEEESAPPAEPAAAETTEYQASAEDAPAVEAEGEFFDSIDVNIVNIEVFVTDKKRNRITGLTRDDFELFENKQPVAITNFYAVEDGRPVTLVADDSVTGTLETPAPEAPPEPLQHLEVEVPEEQRLHLVVYIDNWNIRPFNRNRVFRGIREFLRNELSDGDRVMLMTFDREPHVRRPFTSDAATIASALFEIEKMSANGARLDRERRDMLEIIRDPNFASQSGVMMQARSYVQQLYNDLGFTIDAIKEVAVSLAGLPGRKAILYVSDGLELVPGEDIYWAIQEKDAAYGSSAIVESRTYDLTRRYLELVSTANANRVSFYNIDAAGLRPPTASSAEYSGAGASTTIDNIYTSNLHSSLQLMSDSTGGITILNTNDPMKGLMVVADDFRNYYSIGYSPSRTGTGRYSKLEVKTKRKGLIVRHRDGFRDKPMQTRMAEGVRAALSFSFDKNPLGVVIERGTETPRDDGHYMVPISVRIPLGGLTLLPRGEVHVARAVLFLGAVDDRGGRSEVQEARVPIEIPENELERATQSFFRYDLTLVMRRGEQRLAVGLRDEVGQVSSFAVKTIRVGG
jgi:VWFA-related protein